MANPVSPLRSIYLRWAMVGVVGLVGGAGLLVLRAPVLVLVATFVPAIGLVAFGVWGTAISRALHPLRVARSALANGRLDDVEPALAEAQRVSGSRLVRADVLATRGAVAIRRLDFAKARDLFSSALTIPEDVFARRASRAAKASVRAARAYVEAASGELDAAREDLAAARADVDANAVAHAYAALAEAVVAERSGDREGLRRVLGEHGPLLFEATHPRERALVRALFRMLRASSTSVYRKPAAPETEEPGGGSTLEAYVASIAPSAAPFVRPIDLAAPRPRAPESAPPPPPPGPPPKKLHVSKARKSGMAVARARAAGQSWSVGLVLTVAVAVGFIVAKEEGLVGGRPFGGFVAVVAVVLPTLLVFWAARLAHALVMSARENRAMQAAYTRRLLGDFEGARAALAKLAESPRSTTAANARLGLAQIAETRGAMGDALAQVDVAIGMLATPHLRQASSELLLPAIVGERAFVLAALDRVADAEAALAEVAGTQVATSVRFRVRLLLAVRRGDLAQAKAIADEAPVDLALARRDELLADVVRVVASGGASADLDRMREELASYPVGRAWLHAVAPAVLASLADGASAPA